ncbi:DUF4129 domain-containing protein [Pedobacter sp. JY14-1]|uniref:DUF4129 domain-containing protein n=1 Tax=Pedobacter sp. JY14-1 TaxID=3034151 RepID=UPI0023E18A84|nr:DUF4129 domain-containing protein [Pedobacter sp. JY14-1]
MIASQRTADSLRHFNAQSLRDYAHQAEFRYQETLSGDSWWDRFVRWFWEMLDALLGSEYSRPFITYGAILLLSGLLIFLILKAAGLDLLVFGRASKAIPALQNADAEDIHLIDFNQEIHRAVNAGDYRLAVRMFYLRLLKQLSDRNEIIWSPDKTNRTYITEIQDTGRSARFKKLTQEFERAWYGEIDPAPGDFKRIVADFENFNSSPA